PSLRHEGQAVCTISLSATQVCATKGFRYRRSRLGIFRRAILSQVSRTDRSGADKSAASKVSSEEIRWGRPESIGSEGLFSGVRSNIRDVPFNKSAEDISIPLSHEQVGGNTIVILARRVRHAVFQKATQLNLGNRQCVKMFPEDSEFL
ncbi:MAG: hypothetical protein ACK58T_16295, partial [Phycisphaerae bacterium]